MSVRDQLNNAIYNGLRKNHQKLMSSVAINTGAVADHLLAQGWRPPMRVIETAEELEAVPDTTVVLDRNDNSFQFDGTHFYSDVYKTARTAQQLIDRGFGPVRVVWEPEGEA